MAYFPYRRPRQQTLCGSHQISYVPGSIERLIRTFPEAKAVVVVRDPVRRAYSHFQHNVRNPAKNSGPLLDFGEAVEQELVLLNSLPDLDDIAAIFEHTRLGMGPLYPPDRPVHACFGSYLARGLYHSYLQVMKREGLPFHALSVEGLQSDFTGELTALLRFLDVPVPDRLPPPEVHNRGVYDDPLHPDLSRRLYAFFQPFNERLYRLVGRSFDWESHAPRG